VLGSRQAIAAAELLARDKRLRSCWLAMRRRALKTPSLCILARSPIQCVKFGLPGAIIAFIQLIKKVPPTSARKHIYRRLPIDLSSAQLRTLDLTLRAASASRRGVRSTWATL
jgi:hypothetical protein